MSSLAGQALSEDLRSEAYGAATRTVVFRPLSEAEASRWVAGVTHLSRALIAAREAGADGATVMLAPSRALQERVSAELDRAGCAMTISWQAPAALSAVDEHTGLGDPFLLRDKVLLATVKPTDGLISRRLNRPISRWITARILDVFPEARPSGLTLVTAAIGLAMFAALVFGGSFGPVLGGLLFQAASIVDGVDGEIARATYRSSRAGAAMDTAVDMATNLLFTLGVTIGLIQANGPLYAWVGGAALALLVGGVCAMAVLVRASRAEPSFDLLKVVFRRRFPSGWKARTVEAMRTVVSRDFFALGFALLAMIGAAWTIPWLLLSFATLWVLLIAWGALLVLGPRRLATGNGASQPRGQD